jgi:integrase
MPKRQGLTLTKTRIDNATNGSMVWDSAVPGLGVRVHASGLRTFIFQYRTRTGAQGRMQIGHYPAMTVEQARKLARPYRTDVDAGGDPSRDRKQKRLAPTMADLASYYCGEYAHSRGLRPQTVQAAQGLMDRFVLPRLGSRKVAEIQVADVRRAFGEANDLAGRYSANKLRATLSRMFNLACQMEQRKDNPCLSIERRPEDKRHNFLDQDQVTRLLAACDRYGDQNAADAVRLLLFTGARLREVLRAPWSQFDLEKCLWEKPSHHTKTKIRHQVVLGDLVVQLLRNMRERSPSQDLLFPGQSLSSPRVDLKRPWEAICQDAGLTGYRIHDLRRTFATFMLSTGADLSAVGKALGHTQASTTQRYASLLIAPQRDAANKAVAKLGELRVVA